MGPKIFEGVNEHVKETLNKYAERLGSLAPSAAQTIAVLDEIAGSLAKTKKSLNC
jgi:hypothetical protein